MICLPRGGSFSQTMGRTERAMGNRTAVPVWNFRLYFPENPAVIFLKNS